MDVYTTEQEQLETIKKWLSINGKYIVGAVILVLAVSYGWRYWQQDQAKIHGQASMLYQQALADYTANKQPAFQEIAKQLSDNYASTPYAKLVVLLQAKELVNNAKLDAAATKLRWVMQHARSSSIKQIARIRTARILLAQAKPKQALALLQTVDNSTYQALIDEVKGDILLSMQQPQQARKAYLQALNLMPKSAAARALVQMKADQLAS